jgi:glucokinase
MSKQIMAVDLGGTRVRVALADDGLQIRHRVEEATDHQRGPASVLDQIVRLAGERLRSAGGTWADIACIAIASPGPIDTTTGVAFSPPNMPGWGEVQVKGILEEQTGVPVLALNDASTAALGEFALGAGRGRSDLVYLTVSTGIGGGVVSGGRLLTGRAGMAAELGHMTVDRSGPPCSCGSIGCLESIASGTSIARRFRERLAAGETSAVTAWTDHPTAADVAHGARIGDALALAVWQDAMEALGIGVVNCIHIFNPEIVVLGGGVTQAGDLLFDPVRATVDRYAMEIMRAGVQIVPAALGEDAGLSGAAALGRDFLFPGD